MLVSVVTPTYGRAHLLPHVHRCFARQTWPDREWLVLDDSPQPSPFMLTLDDPRVRYHHRPDRLPLGSKRNWLAAQARGELIAHFDDDDHYTPEYLARMVAHLGDADLVKLAGFFIYSLTAAVFAYWDTRDLPRVLWRLRGEQPPELHPTVGQSPELLAAFSHKNLHGYGFSYLYRRQLLPALAFPELAHGEDYEFVVALQRAGRPLRLVADDQGLALAIRHPGCQSVLFPQYLLPTVLLPRFFPDFAPTTSG